jgi:hypothetical protein|tara:strand:- start:621 stop:923 length:303 start_codon:yes stop_codon:yes gene_type:complete
MGLIQELFKKFRDSEGEVGEELSDEETKDRYLRSLRRERRVMDEEEEKEHLIKELQERKREKMSKHLFGVKKKIERKKIEKKEVKEVLSNDNSWLHKSDL